MKVAWLVPIAALVSACSSSDASGTSPTTYQSLAVSSSLAPPPRMEAAIAYFPPGEEVVLFGGTDMNGDVLSDTWVFDRHGWRELVPATSPPVLVASSMAYDPQLGEIVLLGDSTQLVPETWAFDGATWHELASQHLPTWEPSPLLSWDTATGALELLAPPPGFGPNSQFGNFDTTGGVLGRWSWGSSGWTWDGSAAGPPLFGPPTAWFVPEPGSSAMLYYAYQPYSGSCPVGPVDGVPCGYDPTGLRYSQTWTWNGRSFMKAAPKSAPQAQAIVTEPRTSRVVALAGSEVWSWSGTTWVEQASNALAIANVEAAYDAALGDVVVFGLTTGQNPSTVTWVCDRSTWATTN